MRDRWIFALAVAVGVGLSVPLVLAFSLPRGATGPIPCQSLDCGVQLAIGEINSTTAGGVHYYQASLAAVPPNLSAQDLVLAVDPPTPGVPVPSVEQFTMLDPHGVAVATFNASSAIWTSGGSTVVGPNFVISLQSRSSLSGDLLVVRLDNSAMTSAYIP